jgi:hyaluronan synthase
MDLVDQLALYIPLGILGLVRWLSWVVRRTPAAMYRPVENDHREPLSIVVPVYQEEPDILALAIGSWLRNHVEEIICVIDATDARSIEVAARYPVRIVTTEVPGKRHALRVGWEVAGTPLVALVDSDTVWADDVAEEVCRPFADPRVGGVGTRQNVVDPRTPWQHLNDMYLDYRYFDELASQTVMGRAISCISGRTAVYRRDLLLRYGDEFEHETFLGVPCMSGDDKRLTTLVLEDGYLTVLQRSARVWSTFPRGARGFFRQRLRWSRNTWRSDLRALSRRWVWRHRFLAFSMIDKAVSSFTLLVAPTVMAFAAWKGHWAVVAIIAAWWLVSRSVKIAALLSIRRQRWLTRDVAVSARTRTIVRTGVPVPAAPFEARPMQEADA